MLLLVPPERQQDSVLFGAGREVTFFKPCELGSGAAIGIMIGFSADAQAASNPRRVGQGSTGAGTPHGRRDGSKARAAMKCSLPGLG